MSGPADKRGAANERARRSKKRLIERALGFMLIAEDVLEGAYRLGAADGPDPGLYRARTLLARARLKLSSGEGG